MWKMFVSSWSACMMAPAQRKSIALKKACVTRWNMLAENAPSPTAAIMKPSWLMVEYARTLLNFVWVTAMQAAKIAVKAPMPVMKSIAIADSLKMK